MLREDSSREHKTKRDVPDIAEVLGTAEQWSERSLTKLENYCIWLWSTGIALKDQEET